MTNKTELLPCPFCGSADVKTVVDDGIHFEQCSKCEATGPTGFKRGNEDDRNWNTRVAPAEDVREVAKLTIGQFYTSTCGFGRMEYIGTTYDIDGYLPTFRAQNGKTKAYSHDQLASRFEEFARLTPQI